MAAPAFGHGGGGDIAVVSSNGQVDVGFATLDDNDITQTFFDPNDRVFQAVLTTVPPAPFGWEVGSTEPGFDANEGELPVNALIEWNVVSIKHWDGVGSPNFTPAAGVTGGYGPSQWVGDAAGGFHAHPLFGLTNNSPSPIASGVYLTELTISVDDPQGVIDLEDSEPFYLVALVDDDLNSLVTVDQQGIYDLDAAITAAELIGEETRDYLSGDSTTPPSFGGESLEFFANAISFVEAQVIPEPGAAVLALFALAPVALRRR